MRPKKWYFERPNQNSKTTFIVQTFPKYGPYDFYLVNVVRVVQVVRGAQREEVLNVVRVVKMVRGV